MSDDNELGMLCATTRGRREECPAAGPRDGEIDDADLDMHIYPFPQLLTFFQFANSSIFHYFSAYTYSKFPIRNKTSKDGQGI